MGWSAVFAKHGACTGHGRRDGAPRGLAGSGSRKVLTLVASMLVGGCCIEDGNAGAVAGGVAVSGGGAVEGFGHVRARSWGFAGRGLLALAPDAGELTLRRCSLRCAAGPSTAPRTAIPGLSPAGGGAIRHRRGAALASGRDRQRGNERFARETRRGCGAWRRTPVTVDAGFFSYADRSHRGPRWSYSITIPQNAKVKAAAAAIVDRLGAHLHPRRQAQVAETPSRPAAAATRCAAPTETMRLAYAAAACSAPRASCGPTCATTAYVDRSDTDHANHRGHARSPSETSKKAPGSAPQDSSPPTAPGSPAACCATPRPLDRASSTHPARQLTVAATWLLTVPGSRSSTTAADTTASTGPATPQPAAHADPPHPPPTRPILHAPGSRRGLPAHTHRAQRPPGPNRRSSVQAQTATAARPR